MVVDSESEEGARDSTHHMILIILNLVWFGYRIFLPASFNLSNKVELRFQITNFASTFYYCFKIEGKKKKPPNQNDSGCEAAGTKNREERREY